MLCFPVRIVRNCVVSAPEAHRRQKYNQSPFENLHASRRILGGAFRIGKDQMLEQIGHLMEFQGPKIGGIIYGNSPQLHGRQQN